jgi:hypothetical protein
MVLNVFRSALAFALAGVVVLLVVVSGFKQPAVEAQEAVKVPDAPRKAAEPAEQPPSRAAEIRKLLNQPTDKVKQGIDPGQTLKDVLEFLGRSHGVTFRIDHHAFRQQGADNVEEKQLPRGLPALRDVTLGTVLQDVLNQLEPEKGTYLVRGEFIDVVPAMYVRSDLPFEAVNVDFNKRPLQEALAELGDRTGACILLDARRSGEKAITPITARVQQAPLAVIVSLLADMAELRAVMVAHTLYVTTPENAEKLIERGLAMPPPVPSGGAGGA